MGKDNEMMSPFWRAKFHHERTMDFITEIENERAEIELENIRLRGEINKMLREKNGK